MAETSIKGRREESIHPLHSDAERGDVSHPQFLDEAQAIDVGPYVQIILQNFRKIALTVLVATIFTVLVTSVLVPKYYRAIAILRPIPKAATAGRIAGLFGTGGIGTSPLASLMGGAAGPGADEAQEYMTILQSFAFNTALVERHHLGSNLFAPSSIPLLWILEDKEPRWRAYKRMQKWFSCEYSLKTGNLTLYFLAGSPDKAEQILAYYVDDLREKLRNREVQSASAAIDSMKAETRVTSDALLQSQLYELIAKQTQQLKLAQVEADFAFAVLEPPAARDKPYSPSVILDSVLVGFFTAILFATFLVMREVIRQGKLQGNRAPYVADRR